MIISAMPFVVDVAAICDLLAAEPANLAQPHSDAHEPFGSQVFPGDPQTLPSMLLTKADFNQPRITLLEFGGLD